MARPKKYDDRYFTKEELEEMEKLLNSPEVKKARQEARERTKARTRLYNLRALYNRGKTLLSEQPK